nr:unnamed protein product [Naegleria fowleri]
MLVQLCFEQAKALQVYGDRFHLTLIVDDYYETWADPMNVASRSSYILIGKRKFNNEIYTGYQHVAIGERDFNHTPKFEYIFMNANYQKQPKEVYGKKYYLLPPIEEDGIAYFKEEALKPVVEEIDVDLEKGNIGNEKQECQGAHIPVEYIKGTTAKISNIMKDSNKSNNH